MGRFIEIFSANSDLLLGFILQLCLFWFIFRHIHVQEYLWANKRGDQDLVGAVQAIEVKTDYYWVTFILNTITVYLYFAISRVYIDQAPIRMLIFIPFMVVNDFVVNVFLVMLVYRVARKGRMAGWFFPRITGEDENYWNITVRMDAYGFAERKITENAHIDEVPDNSLRRQSAFAILFIIAMHSCLLRPEDGVYFLLLFIIRYLIGIALRAIDFMTGLAEERRKKKEEKKEPEEPTDKLYLVQNVLIDGEKKRNVVVFNKHNGKWEEEDYGDEEETEESYGHDQEDGYYDDYDDYDGEERESGEPEVRERLISFKTPSLLNMTLSLTILLGITILGCAAGAVFIYVLHFNALVVYSVGLLIFALIVFFIDFYRFRNLDNDTDRW